MFFVRPENRTSTCQIAVVYFGSLEHHPLFHELFAAIQFASSRSDLSEYHVLRGVFAAILVVWCARLVVLL